jgi:transposase, IS5 family
MLIEHEALKELDDVHELINWSRIESLLAELHSSRRGEKAWPPLLMFKALLLQSWYALSDPALEKQLARDLLFRRFIGLSISESVPDHSTLWRFRQLLEKQHIMTTLLNGINDQLAEQGLYIKAGEVSIIDASVIEAKQCRPHKREDGSSTQDPDADWNVKVASDGKRKSTYGYKVHINVDEEGLIKALAYTAGNVHDSNHLTTLLKGNESAAYADSAYQSEMHTDWLTTRGIENRLIKRAYRNRPLSQEDKVFNQTHTGVRSTVERVFGVLKQHYAMGKARYLGIGRNRTRVELMCVAHNIKRGLSIRQGQCA